MVNLEQIKELIDYHNWANTKTLEGLANLSEEEIAQPLKSSFSSIKDTLVHILGVEELWLSRWQGEEGRGLLAVESFPELKAVNQRWKQHLAKLEGYLGTLTEAQLAKALAYKNIAGISYSLELWKQVLHLVNHSTQHRGQIQTMIRQLGHRPPSTDLIYYYLGER